MPGKERRTRNRMAARPGAESLETRQVLTAGAGSTIALIPQTIATPNTTSTVAVKLPPSLFQSGKGGKFQIGLDVAAQTNSAVVPKITRLTVQELNAAGDVVKNVKTTMSRATGSTAALTTVKLGKGAAQKTYQVTATVAGENGTTGAMLVGYYLPGDANGDGIVNNADIKLIKSTQNKSVSSSAYQFDYDVNRDGKINAADLSLAKANKGMSTTQSPVVTANLDASAVVNGQRLAFTPQVQLTGVATPGASITYTEVANQVPVTKTTAKADGTYAISVPLAVGSNTFQVAMSDPFGQTITGQIAAIERKAVVY